MLCSGHPFRPSRKGVIQNDVFLFFMGRPSSVICKECYINEHTKQENAVFLLLAAIVREQYFKFVFLKPDFFIFRDQTDLRAIFHNGTPVAAVQMNLIVIVVKTDLITGRGRQSAGSADLLPIEKQLKWNENRQSENRNYCQDLKKQVCLPHLIKQLAFFQQFQTMEKQIKRVSAHALIIPALANLIN